MPRHAVQGDRIHRVPLERWDLDGAEHLPGMGDPLTLSAQFGAFMRDVDLFDAAAYGLSAAEAAAMDPQHRWGGRAVGDFSRAWWGMLLDMV